MEGKRQNLKGEKEVMKLKRMLEKENFDEDSK